MDHSQEEEELVKQLEKHLLIKEMPAIKHISLSPSSAQSQYERTLFFKVLTDRNVRSRSVIEVFQKAWSKEGKVQVKLFSDGVWIAIFEALSDLDRAIDLSPWHFARDMVLLVEGNSFIKPSDLRFSSYSLWVHFQDLPLELCNETNIRQMAELVGNVVRVECNADNESFTNRALIIFEVGDPLNNQIIVTQPNGEMLFVPLSYERLPRFCTYCGCPGHQYDSCSMVKMLKKQIEKVKDSGKKFELMSKLKPRYDNNMSYRKLSTSKEDASNSSANSSTPGTNVAKSQSESVSTYSIMASLPIRKVQMNENENSNEEINSYMVSKKDAAVDPAVVNLSRQTSADKQKNVDVSKNGRKWKKLSREMAKDPSPDKVDDDLLIAQIKQDLRVSSLTKKKRKMNESPVPCSPTQKLKKAVDLDLLPDNK